MPPRYRRFRRSSRPMRRFPVPKARSRMLHVAGTQSLVAAGEAVTILNGGASGTIASIRNFHGMISMKGSATTSRARGYFAFVKLTQAEADYLTTTEIGNLADSSTDASRFFGVTPYAYQGDQTLYLPMSFRSGVQGAGEDFYLISETLDAAATVSVHFSFTYRERSRDI